PVEEAIKGRIRVTEAEVAPCDQQVLRDHTEPRDLQPVELADATLLRIPAPRVAPVAVVQRPRRANPPRSPPPTRADRRTLHLLNLLDGAEVSGPRRFH